MKKRFLSALLAAALALTLLPTALAATAAEDASQVLAALDIMVGDENGSLNLSAPVTRAEFVKMLMAASPVSVGDETAVSPYPDVPRTHWAAPYVEAAVRAGYVTGYLDGTFRPRQYHHPLGGCGDGPAPAGLSKQRFFRLLPGRADGHVPHPRPG